MATKRQKAGKKAARTRARNIAKRRKAGKKAAITRKRRGTTTAPAKRRTRAAGRGGGNFGGSVVNGFGIALGGGLLAVLAYLLLAPIKKKEAAKANDLAPTVDTTGLSPEEAAVVLATVNAWNGNKSSGGCECWKCN